MTYEQVLKYYGSVKAICAATGLTHQAVYYWKREGISELWQLKLERMMKRKRRRDSYVLE